MAMTQRPTVEMLWESQDAHQVLTSRFGFDDAAAAGLWVAAVLDEHWGVQVDRCERIVMSAGNALAWVTTPSGRLLAKWSVVPERFGRLAEVGLLTRWLHEHGLPVSAPVPAVDGAGQVEVDRVSMGVQRVIDGDLLDVAEPGQVRAAGVVLARLHLALAGYPDADRVVAPAGPPRPLGARVLRWVDTAGEQVPTQVRDTLRTLVDAAPGPPPVQLVHGDYRSSNVLCAGADVVAVIDFEEARFDHCLVEVARSAVMLGTQFRDWGPVSAEVQATFLAGYRSVRPFTPAEVGWWDALVLWQAWQLVPPGDDPTGWATSALAHLDARG